MKAIVQETYGSPDVLELRDIDKPVVGDDDVPRTRARGWRGRGRLAPHDRPAVPGAHHGLRAPKARVRGMDVAVRVEAVGANVTEEAKRAILVGNASRLLRLEEAS